MGDEGPQEPSQVVGPFLVRYIAVDRERGLFRLHFDSVSHGRMTALLTAGGIWTLVDTLADLMQEERAAHDARMQEGTP